ncbi:MAG: hypothetical protein ACOC5M_00255 [Chloroflexota bacterium]
MMLSSEVVQIASVVGSVTGLLALLGLAVTFGTYREKIDRHDQILNVMVQEGLVRSWQKGHLQSTGNPTYRPHDEMIAKLPEDVRTVCEALGRKKHLNYSSVASKVIGKVSDQRLESLSRELEITPVEALGVLVGYTLSVNEGVA